MKRIAVIGVGEWTTDVDILPTEVLLRESCAVQDHSVTVSGSILSVFGEVRVCQGEIL